MAIKPLFDKVVIKAIETNEKTASGIVLPGAVAMQVKVGDTVLYSKYAGSEFKIDGEEVVIVRQSDILAIIE